MQLAHFVTVAGFGAIQAPHRLSVCWWATIAGNSFGHSSLPSSPVSSSPSPSPPIFPLVSCVVSSSLLPVPPRCLHPAVVCTAFVSVIIIDSVVTVGSLGEGEMKYDEEKEDEKRFVPFAEQVFEHTITIQL